MNEFQIYKEWCARHNKCASNAKSLTDFMVWTGRINSVIVKEGL